MMHGQKNIKFNIMVNRQTLMLIITDIKISLKLHTVIEQLISCTA